MAVQYPRLPGTLFVAMMFALARGSASAADVSKAPSLSMAARASISRAIGSDPFSAEGMLTASDGGESDLLGFSVSISGDTAVVGAPNAVGQRGAVYVFERPAAGWESTSAYTARLTASDGAAGDQFGGSVAISGDTVAVGSSGAKIGVKSAQGADYVYVKPVS